MKKTIKLTESELKHIIKESVNRILFENKFSSTFDKKYEYLTDILDRYYNAVFAEKQTLSIEQKKQIKEIYDFLVQTNAHDNPNHDEWIEMAEELLNLDNNINEAFSDLTQVNHIMATNSKDIYDAYVIIDNSDYALIGTYDNLYDAIEDADELSYKNKYGSYSVVGCIGDEYDLEDEKSIEYTTK